MGVAISPFAAKICGICISHLAPPVTLTGMASSCDRDMPKLSVYIPVLNEEDKIEDALKSVSWADEVVVIDTGCTDQTITIAKKYTQRIITHSFDGFGALRNHGVETCSHEWILSLDADERCTPELRDEILSVIQGADVKDTYYIPRRNWFMGRWIKYCGWYPDYCQPKLFRSHALLYQDDLVHEGFDIRGTVGYLNHDILHLSFSGFSQIIRKIDRYSDLGADKLEQKGTRASMLIALLHGLGAFFRIYVLKRGFLDGWAGFIIAFGNFEGTFYRYAKLAARQRGWNKPPRGK